MRKKHRKQQTARSQSAAQRPESRHRWPLPAKELAKVREAGRLAGRLLDQVAAALRPGMSTEEIDVLVDEATRAEGALSAPMGYRGFPKHCCTSINEVVCHGIPSSSRLLQNGDIINVDVTPIVSGYHGDASRTFCIGEVEPRSRSLVEATHEALWRGIAAAGPQAHVGDIGHAIQRYIEPLGFSVVRDFVGHGTGKVFHTQPQVPHFGTAGAGPVLQAGMIFTIEPMINAGAWPTRVLADNWTAVTRDGSLSAQFEHTLLVTDTGVEVLTLGAHETDRAAALLPSAS